MNIQSYYDKMIDWNGKLIYKMSFSTGSNSYDERVRTLTGSSTLTAVIGDISPEQRSLLNEGERDLEISVLTIKSGNGLSVGDEVKYNDVNYFVFKKDVAQQSGVYYADVLFVKREQPLGYK